MIWLSGYGVDGSHPDARFAGNISPLPSRKVEGGVVVSGRWSFASGAPHADWASLGVLVSDAADIVGKPYWCMVPASEMQLEETWRTVGMRGTGSNTWIAEDVFVPAHRTVPLSGLFEGNAQSRADDPQLQAALHRSRH